jgi:multidrug efflux pump subunit AcrA (membrane-fusion protein)
MAASVQVAAKGRVWRYAMRIESLMRALILGILGSGAAWGQAAPNSARIETIPLELTMPDRFQVWAVLEPIRKVTVVAQADGVIRSLEARPGGIVRESQELAQLDRAEASAKLKMALAEVKEKQALLKSNTASEIYQAQLEAAQARAEVAQLELDRCTLRAPFAGMVLKAPISIGQYVLKGTVIAELADVSSFKAVMPVNRRLVTPGSALPVQVEDEEVSGKVQAVLPLSDEYAPLRELATPFACASILFPNPRGELAPGLRARPGGVPMAPIATVPKRALRRDEVRGPSSTMVQVIRNEYVVNIPVQLLGGMGTERVQIAGLLRDTDALIVGASVALAPGTLVRFSNDSTNHGIEGIAPNPSIGGTEAGISPPGTGNSSPRGTRGSSTTPGRLPRRTGGASLPSSPPDHSTSGNQTPF